MSGLLAVRHVRGGDLDGHASHAELADVPKESESAPVGHVVTVDLAELAVLLCCDPRERAVLGDRTLLAYEHGLRQLTVLRLLELCQGAGEDAPDVLRRALQGARLALANLTLRVDVRRLAAHGNHRFRPMVQWARNKLNKCPDGVAELTPSAVIELADFMGCTHQDLAIYLARFLPENADTE